MQKLQNVYRHIAQYKLIYIGLIVNMLFYISAYQTKWFSYFFTGPAVHYCCKGLDFYQIPNGAYAYLHGGSLTGLLKPGMYPYAEGVLVNPNVYHPLFTLLLGSVLILFKPGTAFYVWMFSKFFVMLALVFYFYRSFRESKFVFFALFTMLINSAQYAEVAISQFQFVLNVFLLLLLINLARGGGKIAGGCYYFACLLVKPVGLLWLPVFFCKKQYKLAAFGLALFLLDTVIFLFNKAGNYYTDNLFLQLASKATDGPPQIITLATLLRFSAVLPDVAISGLRIVCLLTVVFLCSLKRVSIFKGIFLSSAYFLLFYDLVYEYHYTIMIPILAVCLVTCEEFQTRVARTIILLMCLPNAFFILRAFRIGYYFDPYLGPMVTTLGWQLLVLSRVIPLIALVIWVVKPDVRPIYQNLKKLVLIIRKANEALQLFG